MRKTYSHNEIDALTYSLLWMTANETEQFNSVLRIPINNMEKNRECFEIYQTKFYHILQIPELAGAPDDYVIENELIDGLIQAGEDIDRILLWLQAIGRRNNTDAERYWSSYFKFSVRGIYQSIAQEKIQKFLKLYKKEVYEPYWREFARSDALEKTWMASPKNRSPYDEMLWKTFYKDVGSSPATDLIQYIYNIYYRRFWRKHRNSLDTQEKEMLYNDFVNFMQDSKYNLPESVNWESVIPIDEAMNIDNIPDFELYAAPAK